MKMNESQFCFWLHSFFELQIDDSCGYGSSEESKPWEPFSEKQTLKLHNQLEEVFQHCIYHKTTVPVRYRNGINSEEESLDNKTYMTPLQYCIWLRGFLEITKATAIDSESVAVIANRLYNIHFLSRYLKAC